ncbi:MAG TPA: hypothetical protein VFJ94_04985 [Intrasporangium sp.]|uniref:hypothetical protein n=1 Tax=Intrasporangium sp. TaxID=1925024 RepID=UPI002D78ECA8|nr:hypothetical protein [Intrasporangium sp.]HET7397857.1 hypothetical protein [Intrasporangium sp.]
MDTSVETSSRHRHLIPGLHPERHVGLGGSLILLGCGAAAVALLGPLVLGAIAYHVSAAALGQVKGGDVAGLLLVAPVSVVAGVLVLRGRRAGPALGLGPAAYGLYVSFQLAVSGDITRYPGNSERWFPLFAALFVLSGGVLVRAWAALDAEAVAGARPPRRVDRAAGAFLLAVAAFLALGLHLRGLLDAWRPAPTSTEYLADPTVFWVVKMMDLGLVVPVAVVCGVGLLRGREWAGRLRYAVLGWAALLASSVAGMALVMQVGGDPAASTANSVVFVLFALVAIGLVAVVERPLSGASRRRQAPANLPSRSA